jgi:hypothetical protein
VLTEPSKGNWRIARTLIGLPLGFSSQGERLTAAFDSFVLYRRPYTEEDDIT